MKASKQCPKCKSLRIGHLATQTDTDGSVDLSGTPAVHEHGHERKQRVVGVSSEVVDTGWLQFGKVRPLIGALEAYVCGDCGFFESYVIEPKSVDWDNIQGFAWVGRDDATGPYR